MSRTRKRDKDDIVGGARDLGLDVPGLPGPLSAITDVPGVEVGFTTIISGDGPLQTPKGPVRTGVTAILTRGHARELSPVWAGIYALNGNGEMTGSHWIKDGGYFIGPILITNTQSVGMAHHAATGWMIDHYPEIREDHFWCMPVVAETCDGCLNDISGRHVKEHHVRAALDSASGGPVAEGPVGGGTGMIAYEFKGGTGTASRKVREHTVGVLVQANHGIRDWLTVFGTRVGHLMRDDLLFEQERGSIIVVVATDAPMMPHRLQRLARRAAIGIGRNGTPGGKTCRALRPEALLAAIAQAKGGAQDHRGGPATGLCTTVVRCLAWKSGQFCVSLDKPETEPQMKPHRSLHPAPALSPSALLAFFITGAIRGPDQLRREDRHGQA